VLTDIFNLSVFFSQLWYNRPARWQVQAQDSMVTA
jgi:hypothetical protein